jgi:D-amino-acid oxidase
VIVSRRSVLQALGTAALGAGVSRCAARHAAVLEPQRRRFAPVHVAANRITRTTVGLRPFRPSGFVVRGERFGEKLLVHNYGHGGGGITLSWGSAALAWEEAQQSAHRRAAVIGCGVIGLSTARLLQQRGWEVAIYAKDVPPHTTSNLAAGQWSPASVFDKRSPEFGLQFDRALRISHRMFQDHIGDHYGVRWLENYVCQDRAFGTSAQGAVSNTADLYFESKVLTPKEHPFPRKFVRRFTTMMVEPQIYLHALLRDYQLAGGRVTSRDFPSPEAMATVPEPVVVNCTGLGAKTLFADEELTPVKGQLTVLLPQPEIDYIVLADDLYMMPRSDGILLGGTHERGEWGLDPNKEAMDRVVSGHASFFEEMTRSRSKLVIRPGLMPSPWRS